MRQAAIVVAPFLRLNNQAVLKRPAHPKHPPESGEEPKPLTAEQQMLAANFTAALAEEGAPTPGQIAEACDVTEQAVSNWKRTGKITKQNLQIVSTMTKWSVHRLLTGQADPPAPPNPKFADSRHISDSDWQLLEDLKWIPQEERDELHERAKKHRAHGLELIDRLKREGRDA
jgi:hypothetical protein